jgi:MYXO-CTERM domain-containing protein
MKQPAQRVRLTAFGAAALVAAAAHASPIFDTSAISGGVDVSASISDGGTPVSDSASLPVTSGGFGGIVLNTAVFAELPDGSNSSASGSLNATFTSLTISVNGSANTDVDNLDGATAGFASASSSLTVVFVIPEDEFYQWSFDGFAGGTHASSYTTLTVGDATLFASFNDFDNDWTNDVGIIGPGTYTFTAGGAASSDLAFFNGLFAGASFDVTFTLTPVPAPSAAGLLGLGLIAAGRRRR